MINRGVLGGIAEYTTDVITLCEASGYDTILVESVGVGQNEIEVDEVVDCFILVVNPGGGDDLQASKKGEGAACMTIHAYVASVCGYIIFYSVYICYRYNGIS